MNTEMILVEPDSQIAGFISKYIAVKYFRTKLIILQRGSEVLDFVFSRGIFHHRTPAGALKLIILAMNVDDASCVEVIRNLKEDERTYCVPIVVFVPHQNISIIKEVYRAGANSCVTKPADYGEYQKALLDIHHYWVLRNEDNVQMCV